MISQQKKAHDSGILSCEFKFSPFSSAGKRREYPRDAKERDFSLILQDALRPAVRLELYPKSSIDISVQVLDCDGVFASVAAAITCASAALANAGIEMKDLVIASSAGFFKDQVVLDCVGHEESAQDGEILVAFMPSLNQVAHFMQNGRIELGAAKKTMDLCIDACAQIHPIVHQALVESLDAAEK